MRHRPWRRVCTALWIGLLALGLYAAGQAPARPRPAKSAGGLTAEEVIKLAKAGLSEDIIIQQIKKNGQPFDLSTEQLIALKAENVSDRIVQAMLNPSAALEIPASAPAPVVSRVIAPPPPAAGKRGPPEAAFPAEAGVYSKRQGQWMEVPSEIVYWKSGGVLKTLATAGIRHGDVNGHIPGAGSHSSLAGSLELLIVAPDGVTLNEYQLLRLRVNKDNREFRTVTGGVLHAQSGSQRDVVPFEGKKLASHVYEVSFPAKAGPGEYGLLPPSSANGSGKIYSFRVTE